MSTLYLYILYIYNIFYIFYYARFNLQRIHGNAHPINNIKTVKHNEYKYYSTTLLYKIFHLVFPQTTKHFVKLNHTDIKRKIRASFCHCRGAAASQREKSKEEIKLATR